jgi:hypothetical protein
LGHVDEAIDWEVRPHWYIRASCLEYGQECKRKRSGPLGENTDWLFACYTMSNECVGEGVGPDLNIPIRQKNCIGNDGGGIGLLVCYRFKTIMEPPRRPTFTKTATIHRNNIGGGGAF